MTIRDRAKVVVPTCPVCAAPITVNWVDVRAVGDQRAAWVPGPIKCSANEDHDVRPVMASTSDWARERDDWEDVRRDRLAQIQAQVERARAFGLWLEDQIATDERAGRAAGGFHVNLGEHRLLIGSQMLAECLAKRRVLARHAPVEHWAGYEPHRDLIGIHCSTCLRDGGSDDPNDQMCPHGELDWPCPEVLDAAAAYSHHPGAPEGWLP